MVNIISSHRSAVGLSFLDLVHDQPKHSANLRALTDRDHNREDETKLQALTRKQSGVHKNEKAPLRRLFPTVQLITSQTVKSAAAAHTPIRSGRHR